MLDYTQWRNFSKVIADAFNRLDEENQRLVIRGKVTTWNTILANAAHETGITDQVEYAQFQNAGYMGLYGGPTVREAISKNDGTMPEDLPTPKKSIAEMAEALEEQLAAPNSDLVGFDERFENIVNHEWELRFNKKLSRFLKKATLKYPQDNLDGTIYKPDRLLDTATIERLFTCHWIEEG